MTGALRGSGRTAALRLAADTAQVLGDVANGVVEPSGLRDLTLRLVQGGGIQKKFAELMLPELQDDHVPMREWGATDPLGCHPPYEVLRLGSPANTGGLIGARAGPSSLRVTNGKGKRG